MITHYIKSTINYSSDKHHLFRKRCVSNLVIGLLTHSSFLCHLPFDKFPLDNPARWPDNILPWWKYLKLEIFHGEIKYDAC
jgi:hypothetical protein